MGKTRAPYPPEYKRRIIELARSGRSIYSVAEEVEASRQTITNWIHQAERDAGERPDGLPTAEREDLTRLRRKVRQLREEREILKKPRPGSRRRAFRRRRSGEEAGTDARTAPEVGGLHAGARRCRIVGTSEWGSRGGTIGGVTRPGHATGWPPTRSGSTRSR